MAIIITERSALFNFWLEKFIENHPIVRQALVTSAKQLTEASRDKTGVTEAHQAFTMGIESLNLDKQLQDASHKTDPMFQWARMYMRQVMTLLQFQRAIQEGNQHLYLASLEH